MNSSLIQTVESYRVDTEDEVNQLKSAVIDDSFDNKYIIKNFSYTLKTIKKTGEQYFIVKVTKIFDDEKMPERAMTGNIVYNLDYIYRG